MNKIFLFLAVAALALQSCEGPEGPAGQQGNPGFSAEAEVFEVTDVDFTVANDWFQTFALNPVILQSDNVLVYELVNTNDNIDTWALLPQVYYFPEGQAQYNFSFSFDQFSIFIDADFDFNALPATFTSNKIFRIVIVPGYFSKGTQAVDYNDYNAVIEAFGINDKNIKVLN